MHTQEAWRLTPGESFLGLRVKSRLGEGAMGCAYLTSHPALHIPLVIKTFKSTVDPHFLFEEARLAARIDSQHVVGVINAGIENGVGFVVQRYVDGIDLEELLRWRHTAGSALPKKLVCRMLIDAARGLHCIHQAGVVHRDVKPANLFLRGNGTVTVGDFGIAVDAARESAEGMIAGTPVFMAPEQWKGESLDRRADIYALGATGHVLATAEPPFSVKDPGTWQQAHLDVRYTPPTSDEPRSAYLFSVIERMLRKSPAARYPNAECVARDLARIAEPVPSSILIGPNVARIGALDLTLEQGDIARHEGVVIVSAANIWMKMDFGVGRALHLAAGPSVQEEALKRAPVSMGDVVWTTAGKLRAKWIAHAVAALDGAVCIQRCTLRVLLGAEERKAESVLFPALGTGIGEVPMDLAATLMLESIRTFAALEPAYLKTIRIILKDSFALQRWRTIVESMSERDA